MALRSTTLLTLLLLFSLSCSSKKTEASLSGEESQADKATLANLKTGEATGVMSSGGLTMELKYAYARIINAFGEQAYSLLLTDEPYSEEALKKGEDLSSAVIGKSKLHFVITNAGKIVLMNLSIQSETGGSSASKHYSVSNRKSVMIGVDDIQGAVSDEDKSEPTFSYKVVFKSSIMKQ